MVGIFLNYPNKTPWFWLWSLVKETNNLFTYYLGQVSWETNFEMAVYEKFTGERAQ